LPACPSGKEVRLLHACFGQPGDVAAGKNGSMPNRGEEKRGEVAVTSDEAIAYAVRAVCNIREMR